MRLHPFATPVAVLAPEALPDARPRGPAWRHTAYLLGPVVLCTAIALILALRALPLTGWARVVFAAAVGLNVALVALSSWGGILGTAGTRRP